MSSDLHDQLLSWAARDPDDPGNRTLNYYDLIIPPRTDRSAFMTSTAPNANAESDTASSSNSPSGRTLVLCFDGTSNQFESNTNVVKFFSLLAKGDDSRQVVYYQTGIGTYSVREVASRLVTKMNKDLDLMFARTLMHHVMSGYKFLMHECEFVRFCHFNVQSNSNDCKSAWAS